MTFTKRLRAVLGGRWPYRERYMEIIEDSEPIATLEAARSLSERVISDYRDPPRHVWHMSRWGLFRLRLRWLLSGDARP